jgi:hypothetical protein
MIPGSQILDGSITDADVDAAAAIDGSKIAAGTVTGTEIADGAVTAAKLAGGAAAGNLGANEITETMIAAAAVTAAKLAGGAAAGNIGANEITETMIASGAVTGVKIAAAAVDLDTQSTGTLSGARVGLTEGAILVGDAGNAGSNLTLTAGQIIIGDAGGLAVAVTMSGDATIDSDGVVTVTPSGATIVDSEIPSGTIDGTNDDFTLAETPVAGSEHVYLNGMRQAPTDDYTIAADVITFVDPPDTGSHILVDYRY